MKKSILITLLISLLFSCSRDHFTGSGVTISEFRYVEFFNKISSEGIFDVNIEQGDHQSIEIIADDNILHHVKTEVTNGRLRLFLEDGNYSDVYLAANIVVQDLEKIENSGAGEMMVTNIFSTGSFELLNNGSSNIFLEGICQDLYISNEGAGDVFAFEMMSSDCSIDNIGSGDIEVNCQSNLNVYIEGSGDVYYRGNPIINAIIEGSGRLIDSN